MINVGVERIILLGRIWLQGYCKLMVRGSDETELRPEAGYLHLYCKIKNGVTRLYYRDDSNVEREINTTP